MAINTFNTALDFSDIDLSDIDIFNVDVVEASDSIGTPEGATSGGGWSCGGKYSCSCSYVDRELGRPHE